MGSQRAAAMAPARLPEIVEVGPILREEPERTARTRAADRELNALELGRVDTAVEMVDDEPDLHLGGTNCIERDVQYSVRGVGWPSGTTWWGKRSWDVDSTVRAHERRDHPVRRCHRGVGCIAAERNGAVRAGNTARAGASARARNDDPWGTSHSRGNTARGSAHHSGARLGISRVVGARGHATRTGEEGNVVDPNLERHAGILHNEVET